MAPSPDLFVVCKNCQAEVSPYITECPYCGHRLRKRAPKLEKGGVPKAPKQRRRAKPDRAPRLGRLRAGELPGIRGDSRPWASLSLVLAPVLVTLLATVGLLDPFRLLVLDGISDPWQPLTTAFFYGSTGYEIFAVGAAFLFGWLLERRHGWWAPLLVFLAGTAAGTGLALAVDASPTVLGANAGALAMLGAWVVRDALAVRAGEELEVDWLGVAAIAIILALLPVAYREANALAGIGGALAGLLVGLALARMRER